jgi:hypothetical protein
MHKTPKTMLAIATFLAVSSAAMAAPVHHAHRTNDPAAAAAAFDARAQAYGNSHYDPSADRFVPNFGDSGAPLFDRAKGSVE